MQKYDLSGNRFRHYLCIRLQRRDMVQNKVQNDTIRKVYDHSIKEFSENDAFNLLGGYSYSYKEFDVAVRKVQDMLLRADIHPGDRVAIFSRSMPNWPVAYFACLTIGIVAVPILPDFTAAELAKLLEHSEAKGLFVGSRLCGLVSESILSKLNVTILTDDLSVIRQNVEVAGGGVMEAEPKPDDLAVIIYTSGTTSSPKGVMLTQFALAMQTVFLADLFPVWKGDIFLSILPLSHTYEASVGMLYPFSRGARVTYLDKAPTAAVLMPAFKEVRPTVMISVPLVVEKIYKSAVMGKIVGMKFGKAIYGFAPTRKLYHRIAAKKLKEALGGRMRMLAIGGAKLNTAAERFLYEGDMPYAVGYGLTETAPLLCLFLPGAAKIGTTGPLVSSTIEAKIGNPNANGEGELLIKTPCIMQGYYTNPEATVEAITPDGWFHTKDMATIDKDGYISIIGRTNFMIVGPSGENIYPEEIENVLNTNTFVSESIVYMENGKLTALVVYDNDKVRRIVGKLEGAEKDAVMEKLDLKIRDFVNQKVNKFSHISVIKGRLEPFEKTPTQKIRRGLYLPK